MGKVKIKAKMKGGKPSKGTLLASVPVTASASNGRDGKKLYKTKAVIVTHINKDGRP